MNELEEVKKDIAALKERNSRVSADKAWEISVFRTLSISLVTYAVAGWVFNMIGADHPWRNALIPTLGWLLSTQSLPFAKRWWIAKYLKDKDE